MQHQENNKEITLKCKMCGKEYPSSAMRLDRNGRDMLCTSCNEKQRSRENILKNVKFG